MLDLPKTKAASITNPTMHFRHAYRRVTTNRGKGEIVGDILLAFLGGGATKIAKEAGHFTKLGNALGAAKSKVADVAMSLGKKGHVGAHTPKGSLTQIQVWELVDDFPANMSRLAKLYGTMIKEFNAAKTL